MLSSRVVKGTDSGRTVPSHGNGGWDVKRRVLCFAALVGPTGRARRFVICAGQILGGNCDFWADGVLSHFI